MREHRILAQPLSVSGVMILLYDAMVEAAKQKGNWENENIILERFIDETPSITDKQHVKHILKLSLGTEANRVEALLVKAKTNQATFKVELDDISKKVVAQKLEVETTWSAYVSLGTEITLERTTANVNNSKASREFKNLKREQTELQELNSKNDATIQHLEYVQNVNPQVDTYFSESTEATFESKDALRDPLHKDWLTLGTGFKKGATIDSEVSIVKDVGVLLNTWFPIVNQPVEQFKNEVDKMIPLHSNFMSPPIFDWHLTQDHVERWQQALIFLKRERTITRFDVHKKLLEVMNGNDVQRETIINDAFNDIWPVNDTELTLSAVEQSILPKLRRYRIKENLFEGMSRDLFKHKYGKTDTNAQSRIDQLLEGPKVKLVWGQDQSTLEDIQVLVQGEDVLKRWMCHSNRPLVQVQNNRETMNGAQWTPTSIGKLCDVLEKEIKLMLPKKKEETTSTKHVVTASTADVRSTNPLDHVTESPTMNLGITIDKTFTESVQTSALQWLPEGHVLAKTKSYILTICEPSSDTNGTHERQYKLLAELYNIRLYVFHEDGTEKNVKNLAYHSFGQLGNVPLAIKRKKNSYVSMLPSNGYSKPSLPTNKSFASRWAILYTKSKNIMDTILKKALLDLLVEAQKYAVVVQSYQNYKKLFNENENKQDAIAKLNGADLYELLRYTNVNYVGKTITHTGNSNFTVGDIVKMEEFDSKNETLQKNRQKLAVGSDTVIPRNDLNQMLMTRVPDTLDFTNIDNKLNQLRMSTQSGAEPESSPISLEGLNRVTRESTKTAKPTAVTAKPKTVTAKPESVARESKSVTANSKTGTAKSKTAAGAKEITLTLRT